MTRFTQKIIDCPVRVLAGLLWLMVLPILAPAALGAQVRVTYIANEGFLVEGGGKKVLIDALFAEGVSGYATVPDAMRAASKAGEAPFDDVDLILSSHFHADHFDAATVIEHLRTNPQALFLSTPQAVAEIQTLVAETDAVLDRVEAVYPPEGEAMRLERAGIEMEALNLHHGRGQEPPVENLGFMVHMGGLTWLHIGDTEADRNDFRPFSLADRGIDVALVPDWFLDYDTFVEVVREEIRPRQIVVMHLAMSSAPAGYFGNHDSQSQRLRAIRENFPDAVILAEPGESELFSN